MNFHVFKWNKNSYTEQKLFLSTVFSFSLGLHSQFKPHNPTSSYTPRGVLAAAYLPFSPTSVETPEGKAGTRPRALLVGSSHTGTQMRGEQGLKSGQCSTLQSWTVVQGCGCQRKGHLFQIYTKTLYRLWAAPIGNTCFNSTTFFTAANTIPNTNCRGGGICSKYFKK